MQLVIELPSRKEQLALNRRRWAEVVADPALANMPFKIETNAHGHIVMMPPASGNHSDHQGEIAFFIRSILGGKSLPECPISTMDGVRAADVGWFSEERFGQVQGQIAFETAPEICVEVISPGNTVSELKEKKQLYFDAGAEEVWLCESDGTMQFFSKSDADLPLSESTLCPTFPKSV